MNRPDRTLKIPPWDRNAEGNERCVGVELEMNGLTLDELAAKVAGFLDLTVESAGRYERVLKGDAAGNWIVELDFSLLKRMGRKDREGNSLEQDIGRTTEELLAWAAEAVVPLEIVGPPLPLERLPEVEKLIIHLRDAGAKGTSDRLVNAFGMQFNPDVPATDADTLGACLKAFLCLYDWLVARADINISRRVTSYIDPFPASYVRKVTAPDYRPDLATLIDDYLSDNPTRNRALDMLPLFLHLDEARVRKVTDDPLIKARPTFHYRLPDCDIDQPDWGLYVAWNDWVEVEKLAADTQRLEACCAAYQEFLKQPLMNVLNDWKNELERRWLDRR